MLSLGPKAAAIELQVDANCAVKCIYLRYYTARNMSPSQETSCFFKKNLSTADKSVQIPKMLKVFSLETQNSLLNCSW